MSLVETYDPSNIFAKIISGDIPSTKIYETNNILAFMDVFPQSDGHSLVILKNELATNLLNVNPAKLSLLITEVQKIANAVKSALSPDGIRIVQFNGAPAGQTVFHLHFHIIPVYEGQPLGTHAGSGPAKAELLEQLAEKIRSRL